MLKEKLAKLMESMGKEEAIKKLYETIKGDSAVVVTAGEYEYEEGMRFKRFSDLKEAYTNDLVLPLYNNHDKERLIGLAYNFAPDENKKAIIAEFYTPEELPVGSGVSAGFFTQEVRCEEGICQTKIEPDHVAADEFLIPRGSENRVIDAKDLETLKAEYDSKIETLEKEKGELKAKLDSLERETLVEKIGGRMETDGVCNHDLKVMLKTLDSVRKDAFVETKIKTMWD